MYFQLQSHNDGDICTPAIIHLWFINLTINSPSADVDKSWHKGPGAEGD